MTTINPYELNRLARKRDEDLWVDSTALSMRRCLSRVINESLSYYTESDDSPIKFFTLPLLHENDEMDYQYLMNFLFFEGSDHYYRDPSNFSKFFSKVLTDNNWRIHIFSKPFRTVNFFMNLPFVNFDFIKVKRNTPTAIETQSDAVKVLGDHFIPIFTGSFDRSSIQSLINRYYQKYPDDFIVIMTDMLQSLYSIEYQKPDDISEAVTSLYFVNILGPICKFISQTSGQTLRYKPNVEKSVRIIDYIGTHENQNETRRIKPDFVIYKEDQAKIIIEMKKPPLFRNFQVPEFPQMMNYLSGINMEGHAVTDQEHKRVIAVLKQLLVYMVGFECMRGILSDGYTIILVEIDESHLGRKLRDQNSINQIPLKLTTFDCKSSNPSYLQGILYFLMKEILKPITLDEKLLKYKVNLRSIEVIFNNNNEEETSEIQTTDTHSDNEPPSKRQRVNKDRLNDACDSASYTLGSGSLTAPSSSDSNEQTFSKLQTSNDQARTDRSIPPLVISWEYGPEVLQNVFDYLSHVVKIKAKFVKPYILEDISDDEEVVVKIFDPNLPTIEKSDRQDIIAIVNDFYRREKKSAEILTRSNVNTLYLKQVYGDAIYNYGFGPLIKGKFIVSRYLANGKLPITDDVFNMARQQLSKIHRAGIIHGDIRDANMLFDEQNHKLYFIDFGSSSTYDRNDSNEFNDKKATDKSYLKCVFED